MIWLFAALGLVIIGAIAFVAVGAAVGRLEHEVPPAVYEIEDAVEFVAERLPAEVTARVSYDDVRTVLRWHLEWFETVGLSSEFGEELGDVALAADVEATANEQASVDAVVARSLAEDGPDPVDVVCILDLQMKYLVGIGALADPDDEDRLRDG